MKSRKHEKRRGSGSSAWERGARRKRVQPLLPNIVSFDFYVSSPFSSVCVPFRVLFSSCLYSYSPHASGLYLFFPIPYLFSQVTLRLLGLSLAPPSSTLC